MKYVKYDTSLRIAERKHQKLEKTLSIESKELKKLQRAWISGKERVRIAKQRAKASTSQSIKNRVNLTIDKQEQLSRKYSKQKTKVSRVKGSIRTLIAEIKNIKSEKRQYERAMEKYEKQWFQFYAKNTKTPQKKVTAIDKVDFGIQLRASRALLNLSANEFSALIDVSPKLLKQIEQPSNKLSLEPQLIKSIQTALKKAGVELIDEGLYVNTGGVGVRIRKKPYTIRTSKPKNKQTRISSSRSVDRKNMRKAKKAA